MKSNIKYIIIHLFFTIVFNTLHAQSLTATDQSAKSVNHYLGIINRNQELVKYIEYSLSERGVPKFMRNLAVIESHLKQNAISYVGASGVWQFMIPHASNYGLSAEERNDMYKSTKVAAQSLANLYRRYNNWVTVVAAYNCGEGNIQKAMDRSGSRNYTSFAPYLPLETQNHVKKFLNASYATGELESVLQDYYKTPIKKSTYKEAAPVQPVAPKTFASRPNNYSVSKFKKNSGKNVSCSEINATYNLDVVAKYLDVSKKEILKSNPRIEKDLKTKGECQLCLNEKLILVFEVNRSKILRESLLN